MDHSGGKYMTELIITFKAMNPKRIILVSMISSLLIATYIVSTLLNY